MLATSQLCALLRHAVCTSFPLSYAIPNPRKLNEPPYPSRLLLSPPRQRICAFMLSGQLHLLLPRPIQARRRIKFIFVDPAHLGVSGRSRLDMGISMGALATWALQP